MTHHEKERYKRKRIHDLRMFDAVREIVSYTVFLIFAMVVVRRDPQAFAYRKQMNNTFYGSNLTLGSLAQVVF